MALVTLAVLTSWAWPCGTASGQDGGTGAATPAKEQSIYIPYKKLRDVFEREGRGVFLPYEQFRALWRAAREGSTPTAPERPPLDALITETVNEATVSRDVVSVKATVSIELLKAGWNEVPLRLGDAAITAATIDGEPARLVFRPDEGYRLLHEKPDDAPATLQLELEYAKSYDRVPGRNSVAFAAPQAPISRWRVTVREAGVKINLRPLIAATEVPAEPEQPDRSVVLAFVGATPSVGIDWTPRSEGATGLVALADVVAEQQLWIDEGVARTRADLVYEISRAELASLAFDVPLDEKIVEVSDANVRQWSVDTVADGDEQTQRVTVELFEPVKGRQRVRVELERFTGEDDTLELAVPVVRAVAAARQGGVVVLKSAPGLNVQTRRSTGLIQVDSSDLPPTLARSPWDFAYRYSSVPFELVLDVEKVRPFITVETLTVAQLSPEELILDAVAVYDVRRAGIFELQVSLPRGFDVREVTGRQVKDVGPVHIDAYHLDEEDPTRLTVQLSRKAVGQAALGLRLARSLEDPALITPGDAMASIQLAVPRAVGEHVERESGHLVVVAPESLRVNPKRSSGLRSVPPAEALSLATPTMLAGSGGQSPAGQIILAYAYAQDTASLTLDAQRRRPYVTVAQLLAASVEPGLVRYDATLFLDVKYSGIKSLRIDVPAGVSAILRNTTNGVRDEIIDPPPADLGQGDVAWRLTGERELLGTARVDLTWDRPLENLDVGKSVELVVPRLRPRDVDRSWGQVVIVKSETVDVHASGEPVGLRPIDPQHDLMPGARVPDAARAFEFQDDWSLTIAATRYELEEVKRTSIERALLRMVLTRSDQVTVQAIYRMRSARQRLALTLPDGAEFDTQPVRINGSPATLERGKPGEFFIPLPAGGPDTTFLLEIRYVRTDPETPFAAPSFPDDPAAQMAYCSVHLPENRTLLGSTGPWNQAMRWRERGWLDWRPVPLLSDSQLLSWISEGVTTSGSPAGDFQADGRRYLFSSARPVPGAEGTLALVSLNSTLLSLIVLVVVAGGGLLLLRQDAASRVVAVGLLVIALVAVGVFMPTLSRQIMDRVLLAAATVVAVAWIVQYLVWRRPRDPLVIARREARIAAARAKAAAATAAATAVVTTTPSGSPLRGGPPPSEPDRDRATDGDAGSEGERHE